MRLVSRFSFLVALVTATFAQDLHLTNYREILLDDFPVLVSGYRLQIGAFGSEKSAVQLKESLQSKLSAKIHLRQDDGKWLVRVGDFRDSLTARDFQLRHSFDSGIEKARLVSDQIPVNPATMPSPVTVPGYRLQVHALADCAKAITTGRDLSGLFPEMRVHVICVDSLYKVQLGDFKDSTETLTWKDKITGTANLKPIIVQSPVYDLPPPKPAMSAPRDIFKYDD